MTNDVLKRICDEQKMKGNVCGRCAKWGNAHLDDDRPVYTLRCDDGQFTAMWGTCPKFVEG